MSRRTLFTLAILIAAAPVGVRAQEGAGVPEQLAIPASLCSGKRSMDVLRVQTRLDRGPFSPGVVDGVMGSNTRRAVAAFEQASGLPASGEITPELIASLEGAHPGAALRQYTISEEDLAGPFAAVPASMSDMAKLDHLGFQSTAEALAEKLHMDRRFLEALNPGVDFGVAGTNIVVIAGGGAEPIGAVARIEVDKEAATLRAFDDQGALLATFPATIGSGDFPSPSGAMEVRGVAPEPKYYFDPEGRDWGPDERLTIAAGPNNPVGGTWIDLTKEGYGIHGTPDPRLIGKTASHGCVRLTNWDAAALAKAVKPGTSVVFVGS